MTIYFFHNAGCGACKLLSPIIDTLGVEVKHFDTDKLPEVIVKYNILSLPTVIFMDGDKEVYRFVGYRPKLFIEAQLKRLGN